MHAGQIPRFEMILDLDGIGLAPMRDSLTAWLTDVGVREQPRRAVVLAAHEAAAMAVMNVAPEHQIRVSATLLEEHVLVEVTDRATGPAISGQQHIDRDRAIALLSSLVEHAEIETASACTTVRLWESLSKRA